MALIFKHVPHLIRWVTCTTRKPREGEVEGKQYFFKTPQEFKFMIDNNQLVEWNEFADNFYGTPKKFAEENLTSGKNIITAIDVNGAMNVKQAFNNAILIFIEPPSLEELKNRLVKRGTESIEYIEKRLAIVSSEIDKKDKFDITFINDNLQHCADNISLFIKNQINNLD